MRQTLKDRQQELYRYRGLPVTRMLPLVLMLVIMGLIFVRLRDPNTWRWFTQDGGENQVVTASQKTVEAAAPAVQGSAKSSAAGKPAAASGKAVASAAKAATPPELLPTGPTDLDPIEQDEIKDPISVVTDGTMSLAKQENIAYYQVLAWVDHQSTALLEKRAKRDVRYSDFLFKPDSMRLQIVELNLSVRQIVSYTDAPKNGITQPMKTHEGHPLYEVCGVTREGGTNIYIGVVTDLPEGMPIGTGINEDAKLVGYFFKLQGYISGQQQLEAEETRRKPKPLKAPLIIGRLVWVPSSAAADEAAPIWLLATIGGVAVVVIVGWVAATTRGARRRAMPTVSACTTTQPKPPPVDNWLEQAQSGRLALEPAPESTALAEGVARDDDADLEDGFANRFSGNIFGENGESNNGNSSVPK